MQQIQSTISAKYQTVIPAPIRQKLHVGAGAKLIWRILYVGNIPKVIAEPKPKSWAVYTKGLGKAVWKHINIEEYITHLHEEWKEK